MAPPNASPETALPVVHLSGRSLVTVSGPDAREFLQNLITTDLSTLGPGEARAGALLAPQGKILFDFLVSLSRDDAVVLECRAYIADDLVRRLTLYKLRAKVTITKQDQEVVVVSFGSESGTSQADSTSSLTDSTASGSDSGWLADSRFSAPAAVARRYGAALPATASEAAWTAFRIAHGVAESGVDYALGDVFPHDVLLDQNNGVGFKKGCYVGQEVVSRMQHRGTARRRVLVAAGGSDLPPSGTDITADGRSVGTMASVLGSDGLAVARIDKVKAAMDQGVPLLAGGATLTLAIPPGARFAFPESASAGSANADDA